MTVTRLQHGRNQVPSRKQEARHCLIAEESSWGTVPCRLVTSTLDDPVDCSLPGSSVHGILQARILQWVAVPSSRGSSRSRDQTHHLLCLLLWREGSLSLVSPGKPKRDMKVMLVNSRQTNQACHFRYFTGVGNNPLILKISLPLLL